MNAKSTIKVSGDPNLWVSLQVIQDPASGWTKTTRAMNVPGGVLVNTCTRGQNAVAEALVAMPGLRVVRGNDTRPASLQPAV